MAGCLKRYTDPSSLRKHVKNHVTKQLDHTAGRNEKSPPRNIIIANSNGGQDCDKLSRRQSRHGSTSSSVNSYEESPADWENGGKFVDILLITKRISFDSIINYVRVYCIL